MVLGRRERGDAAAATAAPGRLAGPAARAASGPAAAVRQGTGPRLYFDLPFVGMAISSAPRGACAIASSAG
jgi:hypothetical protein